MSSAPVEPADLLDLRLLPAWVKEPGETKKYERYTGEEESGARRGGRDAPRGKAKRRTPINREQAATFDKSLAGIQHPTPNADRRHRDGLRRNVRGRERHPHKAKDGRSPNRHSPAPPTPPEIAIRFFPYSPAFENVVVQIKSGSVSYSLFALARLFLEKPVGYVVCLTARQESPLFQLATPAWCLRIGNSSSETRSGSAIGISTRSMFRRPILSRETFPMWRGADRVGPFSGPLTITAINRSCATFMSNVSAGV